MPPSFRTYTYHCICSNLLLTAPYEITSLPRRAPPSLDRAYILPLPAFPTSGSLSQITPDTLGKSTSSAPVEHLPSLPVSVRIDRKPHIIQREDGWEKRQGWRCGRCGLLVGYELAGVQELAGQEIQEKVAYLLEGCLFTTEEMVQQS